jgi:hypothetical protein
VSRIVIGRTWRTRCWGSAGGRIVVVFWPHLIPPEVLGSKHRLHPRDDPENPLQGVLATRSQIGSTRC